MTKKELIQDIAGRMGVTHALAEEAVGAMLDSLRDSFVAGNSVTLRGFGSFLIKQRSARTGRNPNTGEPIDIPESLKIDFKPSPTVTDALNGR